MIKKYSVKNLDCAGCAAKIQYELSLLRGVVGCDIDLYKNRLTVDISEAFHEMEFLDKANAIANKIEPGTLFETEEKGKKGAVGSNIIGHEHNHEHCHEHSHEHSHEHVHVHGSIDEKAEKDIKDTEEKVSIFEKYEKEVIILGIILFVGAIILKRYSKFYYIPAIMAYILLGWDVVLNAFKNLKNKNFLDENFLMTIATFGAFYLGEIEEAVGVMLFYKIGEYFQDLAVNNSRKSIEKLLDIKPEYANITDANGELVKVSPETLNVGDIITVKAGEKIPVDGVVVKGSSSIDTSALTGESLPVDINVDSSVLSGSVNGNNVIQLRVKNKFEDSAVSKIINMVENASSKKAKSEKFITKFAKYYTPIVVGIALIVAFVIPTIIGNYNMWIQRALIFLVISCPCALVISVPLGFFSSIGHASKQGILIKGGNYLERLTDIDAVVFDKTGTLTKGIFKITKIESEKDHTTEEIMETAAIGEYYSNHPISMIFKEDNSIKVKQELIKDHEEIPGYGVVTKYDNDTIYIGNYKLMAKQNIQCTNVNYPGTILYVAKNNDLIGKIFIGDEIKADSKSTIEELKKNSIAGYMLTGDNKTVADHVGEGCGLDPENIYSQLLPQNKVSILERIKNKSQKGTIFVGDGINDAPALAMADIGVAMGGSGSDIAVETADVVIMRDEPSKIIELLRIAKKNKKIIMENIIFSIGIKVIVMILGIFGLANMWMAIFADTGVALLAVMNSIRAGRN